MALETPGSNSNRQSLWIGLISGILYGALARLIAHNHDPGGVLGIVWLVMTLNFLFVMPAALGAITIYSTEKHGLRSWAYAIFAPWVPSLILLGSAWAIGLEGSICLIMGSPIFLIFSSLGGIIAHVVN